jgi:hypothetical protein
MQDLPNRLQDALYDLGQYLSDMVAPLVVADGFTTLMDQPPDFVAAEIQNWTASQYHGAGEKLPVSDYLYHAVKKLMMLGDYGLVPKNKLIPYLESLVPKLAEICPEQDRAFLLDNLRSLRTEPLIATPTAVIHRQAGSAGGGAGPAPPVSIVGAPGAAPPAGQPGAAPPGAPILATARSGAVVIGLGNVPAPSPEDQARITRLLGLLMERYERDLAGQGKGATPPPPQLAGQIVAAMAEKSTTGKELNEDLEKLKQLGVTATMDHVFKFLGDSMPAWSVPEAGSSETPAAGSVGAMSRIVAMAEDATEAAHRYHELVRAAVGQFNDGHLARAATMFELAEKLADDLKVKPGVVDSLRRNGHEALSTERMKEYCERPDKHTQLQTVMRFYLSFRPDGLLGELQLAQKRDRRRMLLALIEAQGEAGRERVVQWLADSFSGTIERDDWQLQRNLALLLRRMPRHTQDSFATEVESLVRLADFERPLPLVKEVIATLGTTRSEKAEVVLVRMLQHLEERMLAAPEPSADDKALVERVTAALVRQGLPAGRRAVIAHGLRTEARLGDTAKHLVELGRVDLSSDKPQLDKLTKALHDALPRKMLGVTLKPSSARAVSLVRALAGTPAALPVVEEALRAASGTEIEREARKILDSAASASSAPTPTSEEAAAEGEHTTSATARLSGDLELFGLPNLLHSLYHSAVVGTLHLEDSVKNEIGWLQIVKGKLVGASVDPLTGAEALYQLLERPSASAFRFKGQPETELPSEGTDILGLLMEGLRRSDELHRAVMIAPDEAALEATGAQPRAVRGEKDMAFLKALWSKASAGVPPVVCEEDAAADAYRVRRQIASWVEQGALKPRG